MSVRTRWSNGYSATAAAGIPAADTIFQLVLPAVPKCRTRIKSFAWKPAGTAHVATVRKSIGFTTLSQAEAASQAVIHLTAQPTAARNVAGNDFLIIENMVSPSAGQRRRNYVVVKVTSVVGLAITLTANVPNALLKGARVWLMSLDADVIPGYNNTTNQKFTLAASTLTSLPTAASAALDSCVASTEGNNEPLLFEVNNATAQATLFDLQADAISLA